MPFFIDTDAYSAISMPEEMKKGNFCHALRFFVD